MSGRPTSSGSWLRRRTLRRARVLALVSCAAVGAFALRAASADPPPDPRVERASQQLQDFASMLGRLDQLNQLGQQLPLSDGGLADFLDLADVFDDDDSPTDAALESIKERLLADGDADWASLASALDDLDDTYGSVHIEVSGPASGDADAVTAVDSAPASTNTGTVSLPFEVRVYRDAVPVPVLFDNALVDLDGGTTGTFPVNVEVRTTPLQFVIDKAAITSLDSGISATAVALRMTPDPAVIPGSPAPAIKFKATAANADLGNFMANLGFTQIDVDGDLTFDITGQALLRDPDDPNGPAVAPAGDDKISADEYATTALTTLLGAEFTDENGASPAVSATLRLESSVLEPDVLDGPDADSTKDHDASITFLLASLTGASLPLPDSAPTVTLQPTGFGSLADFRNFSADEAAAALDRLVQFLEGLQSTGKLDVDLPFLRGRDTDTDPATNPTGTFSDALALARDLKNAITTGANKLRNLDDPATPAIEPATPTFSNIQGLLTKLGSFTGGTITPTFVPASGSIPSRLEFTLSFNRSGTAMTNGAFDNLDALSNVRLSSGPIAIAAKADLSLPMFLSLETQPVEDGAEQGSCTDGLDNAVEDDDAATVEDDAAAVNPAAGPALDVNDPDCTGVDTLEQRVGIKVGTGAPTDVPEVQAGLRVNATGIGASARLGMLEAAITASDLRVVGTTAAATEGSGAGTCTDGDDDDSDGLIDAADPDCWASIAIDFKDTADGLLTVQDLFNTMGETTVPATASLTAVLKGALKSTIPVSASLGAQSLGGGDIVVTAGTPAAGTPLDSAASLATLLDGLSIDTSDLRTEPLFDFSPCSNNGDDDGDGKINDGCGAIDGPDADTIPEPETACDDALDNDSDGTTNDGCPASDDAESVSAALFNRIIDALRALTAGLDESGLGDNALANAELPVVGKSPNELLDAVQKLTELADGLASGAESAIGGCGVGDTDDDDFDGAVNDGCPTVGSSPEASGVDGQECANSANNDTTDDGGAVTSAVVNDGCPPLFPTLNSLGQQIQQFLDTHVFANIPGSPSSAVTLRRNASNGRLELLIDGKFKINKMLPFNLALEGGLAELVSLDATGEIAATVEGSLSAHLALDLENFDAYLLGGSGMALGADVDGRNMQFGIGVGPLRLSIGQETATGETDCGGSTDDDGDGTANDGCAADGAAETDCTGTGDEDGDGKANDGCTTPVIDRARFDLGAKLSLDVTGDDTNAYSLTDPAALASDITISADGITQDGDHSDPEDGLDTPGDAECDGVAVGSLAAGDDKDACAILPIYFNDAPLDTTPSDYGHQLRFAIADITSPTFVYNAFDESLITDLIAGQLVDLLLLNSGLDQVLTMLEELLENQLFGFDLPFVGDQLKQAAKLVADLRSGLKEAVRQSMLTGGVPTNPLAGLDPLATPAATARTTLVGVRDAIATFLRGPSVDLLRDQSNDGVTNDDLVLALRCVDGNTYCDTGAENDPTNQASGNDGRTGPDGGSAADCTDDVDDDGDGKTNDGCPTVGSFPDPDCANSTDEADEDPNTENDPVDDDTVVNDGCAVAHGHKAVDVFDVSLAAKLGRPSITLLDESLDFGIGVPGLSLEARDAKLSGTLDWSIDFGFGISKDPNVGFYFVTGDPDELSIGATFGVTAVNGPPAELEFNLGFVKVTATDGDPATSCAASGPLVTPCQQASDTTASPASSFNPEFTIDLDGGPDGRLTFNEIASTSFGDLVKFDLTADAVVNLHLEASIDGDVSLPRLIADLHLDWAWSLADAISPDALQPGAGDLNIALSNVTLDAGTFFSEFLKPILQDVQKFTKPFDPLIKTLQAPVPVISDLAGEDISLLDLAEELAPAQYNIELIVAVIKIVDFINSFNVTGNNNLQIPLNPAGGGTVFDLNESVLQGGELAEGDARRAFANAGQLSMPSALGAISTATSAAGTAPERKIDSLASYGFKFPFIQEPGKLIGLLFKQDVDLVVFEAKLSAGFSYSQKFGPIWSVPPVFLEVGGSLNVSAQLGIGYDTQGLRELLFDGASPDALLHGLFLIDYAGNEFELRGELFANAQVSVLIFSAGAGGSVYLTVGVDVNDPNNDGRLKFQEAADILRATGSPLCLFNLNGQFGVRIFVFAEVDLFFWSQRWEKTLADIVLYEFKVECAQKPEPVLASPDPGNAQTLVLHMGVDEGLRDTPPSPGAAQGSSGNSIGSEITAEKFVVKMAEQNGQRGVTVEALGLIKFYPNPAGGWQKILVRDAGLEADSVVLADGTAGSETNCANNLDDDGDGKVNDGCPKVAAAGQSASTATPESACAEASPAAPAADNDSDGFINDGCPAVGESLPFNLEAEIHMGSGNDAITGGVKAPVSGAFQYVLDGGSGDDQITARGGNNKIIGGLGKDKLGAAAGTDTIWGDNENNTGNVDSDLHIDTIDGGAGGDTLYGGGGGDTINGGLAFRDVNAPKVNGQFPLIPDIRDVIEGNDGPDTIEAGDGDDDVKGQAGADRITGGKGLDTISGGDEASTGTCTSTVHDVLVGGPDADTITAGDGDDIVIGGSSLAGQPDVGDTLLDGGDGCDFIFGDNATLDAALGPRGFVLIDPLVGGADRITGGNERDTIRGQVGGDTIRGDDNIADDNTAPNDDASDGVDTIRGDDGDDRIWGDGAGDTIFGDAGSDDISGGLGNDTIEGAAGQDIILGDDGFVARTTGTPSREDDAHTLLSTTGGSALSNRDTIRGGLERDRIYGELGNDTLKGDEADDDVWGNQHDDVINGNTGNDYLVGNNGADDVFGDAGNDRMIGGSPDSTTPDDGTDELYGRTGDDTMTGDNATISAALAVELLEEASIGARDLMYGEAGEDEMYGERGMDFMSGGFDDDYLEGNADRDTINGDEGDDDLIGGTEESGPAADVDAEGEGGQPDDGDTITGGLGADVVVGDNGRIERTGQPSTFLAGAEEREVELFDLDSTDAALSGDDTITGNESNDEIYAGGDGDTVHGNGGDDHAEGNGGSDDIWGDDGQDDLIGGTSAEAGNDAGGAHPDAGDDIFGDNGDPAVDGLLESHDVIAGDNASILRSQLAGVLVVDDLDGTRPANLALDVVRRQVKLFDLATVTETPSAPGGQAVGGGEVIHAEKGADRVYGQTGVDTLFGETGDDYLEAGDGADTVYGGHGQDDILGGTGRQISDDPSSAADGRLDGADFLYGADAVSNVEDDATGVDDFDVIMGDNATILRDLEPAAGDAVWEINTFNASVRRRVFHYDVASVTNPVPAATSGGDTMRGEADDDVMYGQGAGDTMEGNGGDDYMEGNAAADTIRGQLGDDDVAGGTGRINNDGPGGVDGRHDAGEVLIAGGDGFDFIVGDNGIIDRVLTGTPPAWVQNTFNAGVAREPVRLKDINSPNADVVSGGDVIEGNDEDDIVYGQGGDDTVSGDTPVGSIEGLPADAGQDYLEGNAANDSISGGPASDDIVGGTGRLGGDPAAGVDGRFDGDDTISGEEGTGEGTADGGDGDGDFITGDNAVVGRPLASGLWTIAAANDVVVREHVLRDIEVVGSTVSANLHGADVIHGNDNDDTVYGQGGPDRIFGNAGDDHLVGNHDADVLHGNGQQDDMIGGNEAAGQLDVGDQLFGEGAADFQIGDSGTIVRPLTTSDITTGLWRNFAEANTSTTLRVVTRFDVGGPAGTAGDDTIQGDAGDDYQWGQDGNDLMNGNDDNDDMYGELGADRMYGDDGEDAMLGDRGGIVDRRIDGSAGDPTSETFSVQAPPAITFTSFRTGMLDRRFDLHHDVVGDVFATGATMPFDGLNHGGPDFMKGGRGHDSMHGGQGNDVMNGDSGGDILFGSNGSDAMWGGKGCDTGVDPTQCTNPEGVSDLGWRGASDEWVDYLFGGHGEGSPTPDVTGTDFLDYRPRGGAGNCDASPVISVFDINSVDPCLWHEAAETLDADPANNQHHQGIDWIYGGFDRDVMQADQADEGPNPGDRLLDWTGVYNLYTHCNPAYGGFNDVREMSPQHVDFLNRLAYALGAGPTMSGVLTPGASGYRELGLVYKPDVKVNSGRAYPSTPGHFDDFSCAP